MTKYKIGDIECSAIRQADGNYQGHVLVKGSVLNDRPEISYFCEKADSSETAAIIRAREYADENFPPE